MTTNSIPPELKTARDSLARSVAKTQDALFATAEYKAFEAAREQLQKFDQAFNYNEESVAETTPVTKGRKAKPATAKSTKKKAEVKQTKQTKKAAAKTDKVAKNDKATEGRRSVLRGERPPLKEAMIQIMGDRETSASAMASDLIQRGWAPKSGNLQNYISFTFSKNNDTFERVSHGVYRVKKKALAKKKSTEESLAELGIEDGQVAQNPFA